MIALDTECTGLDLRHGARPFLTTVCAEDGVVKYWEWPVCPFTRMPSIPKEDLEEIRFLVESKLSERLVLQNAAFDCEALTSVLPGLDWPWEDTEDTLIAGHLLHSGQPHDLTSMALLWLGKDIQPYEDRLKEAVKKCRSMVQQARLKVKRGKANADETELARWMIAEEDLAGMPSAKGGKGKKGVEASSPWKFDCWLPRAMALRDSKLPRSWLTVCSEYANVDSSITLPLFKAQLAEIKRRGLEAIYRERIKLLPCAWGLKARGTTYLTGDMLLLRTEFFSRSAAGKDECLAIAERLGAKLELHKGASPNGSLRRFMFDVLKVPRYYNGKAKSAEPTLNKDAMERYRLELDGDAGRFVAALTSSRKCDTQLAYMANYERHALDVQPGVKRLHGSANPTGTDHLRWSFANPNMANVSKQEVGEKEGDAGRTLRYLFGPAPDREWWAFDFENLELRIPGCEAPEPAMIELFERPDEPPYFGSYHLLNASIIYPDLFAPFKGKKDSFKNKYKTTWYQWVKNAGFALIYGCQEETFDRTARKDGAYEMLRERLPNLFKLADRWIAFADKHGYVETMPDQTVDPKRGYPIECSRSEWGRISPTVPLNYHVSGTAMQATNKAMVRTRETCVGWSKVERKDYFLTLQVHDELVFDFPAGGAKNLPKVKALKALMEQSGDDIGVPLKVSVSWHPRNWGEAVDWRKKEAQVA